MEWGILIATVTILGMLGVGISEATNVTAPRPERREGKVTEPELKKAA